jgi:hypothetical protein
LIGEDIVLEANRDVTELRALAMRQTMLHPAVDNDFVAILAGMASANCSPSRSVPNRPTQPRPQRPTSRACCRVRAPAAAHACSSSRPSRAAVSPSTDRHPCRRQSGSTPHDAVTADPPPKRHQPFAPDLDRHRPRLCRPVRLACIASAIPVNKPPVRSFSPARTPTSWAKAMGSTASRHSL